MSRHPAVDSAYLRVESRPMPGFERWKRLTVACPRRGTIGLEVCIECTRLIEVDLDPETNELAVVCDPEPPPARSRPLKLLAPPPCVSELERTPVSALLPAQALCLSADLGVREVATLLMSRGIARAPVVDANARPLGVLSTSDILRWWWQDGPERHSSVGDIMGPVGFCLPDTTSIAHAAAAFVARDLDSIVVVSPSGSARGVLSARDMLDWVMRATVHVKSDARYGSPANCTPESI